MKNSRNLFQPFLLCGNYARANFRSVLIYSFLAEELELNLSLFLKRFHIPDMRDVLYFLHLIGIWRMRKENMG